MAEKKDSIHKNHRQRVKKRYRDEGLDHFDEVNVLEMLLFFGVPQGDTNPLAHRLLEQFGSLSGVLDAPVYELEKVNGVGEHVAIMLSMVRDLSRYYMVNRSGPCPILTSTRACGEFMLPHFVGRRDETVFLLCLDSKCKVIGCKEVGSGTVNSASVSARKIVETALAVNATSVVLAHNHPSGVALPSSEDLMTTRRLAMALDGVGILLADHVIVAEEDYVSLAESGYYNPEDWRLIL